jgi:hypothetical protein
MDSRNSQAFTLKRGRKTHTGIHFTRLFISNIAQAGKIVYLIIGGPEDFDFDDVGAISVNSITDPIFANVIKGPQTQNNGVTVGVASTLLRAVPANTIEMIRLNLIGQSSAVGVTGAVYIGIGAAAVIDTYAIYGDIVEEFLVSGGAAGLSIFGISPSGDQIVKVLAVPIK